MKEQRPIVWFGLLALAALVFLGIAYMWPSNVGEGGKKLGKKEEKVVRANIGKLNERAKADTLAAAAIHQKAERTEANIQQMRKEAIILHKKSISHATPIPVTDAAIDSLQSYFSTFGDKPRPALPANLR